MTTIENGKTISILGFRNVRINDVNGLLKEVKTEITPATAQIIDAKHVAGKPHLLFAFLNAQKSFEKGRAISENISMETLLYASGNRQISRAIEMLGVKSKTSKIAVMIFASSKEEAKEAEDKLINLIAGVRDDRVLEIKGRGKVESLMKTFKVTDLEIETMSSLRIEAREVLTWLIVERGSLLSIKR